jgi:D-3-phosphoglycerate dehydrogenase
MNVNAYDPFLTAERAEALGVNLADLDTIITGSDFITVHTPLTADTKGLFGAKEFARMKKGVRVVNCARGGIYDEVALAEAIKAGQVAGAALDVYVNEPPTNRDLIELPQVVVTPHLGASTREAQENVAIDVAVEVIKILKGKPFKNAVNLPPLRPEVKAAIGPFFGLAEVLGRFIGQIIPGRIAKLEVSYMGELANHDTSYLSLLFTQGLLQASLGDEVNPVNALILAKERGLKVNESKVRDITGYANLIKATVTSDMGIHTLSGTMIEKDPRIVEIEGYRLEVAPNGNLLMIDHIDQPGIIGQVGTVLGESLINIAAMQVGRKVPGGKAIMVLRVDSVVAADTLEKLAKVPNLLTAKSICF